MIELKNLMLRKPRLTLAVAESLTCGRMQARVGLISGASEFFLGGITAYTLDQKVRHLGVDRGRAAAANGVSAEIAAEMADGVCGLFGASVGVATTGYAEPSAEWAVDRPFAWWAVAYRPPGGKVLTRCGKVEWPGASRAEAQERTADAAMEALIAWVEGIRAG
jgi:nicotinamide-nucleotide amidase